MPQTFHFYPKLNSKQLKTVVQIIVLLTTLSLLVDSVGNPESIFKVTGIHSYTLIIPGIALFSLARWKYGRVFSKISGNLLAVVALVVLVTASVATLFDFVTPTNTLFALTKLHQSRLLLLGIFVSQIALINLSNSWWKKYRKKILFIYPFLFFYFLLLTALFPFNLFAELVKEDRFIEYFQFFMLAFGSLACFKTSFLLSRRGQKMYLWSFFFFICALGLGLVAGDEISWGQRILHIESSDTIRTINRQQELTVHNLYAVEWLVIYGYVTLSFAGMAGQLIMKKIKLLKKFTPYAPSRLLFGYFLLPFIFFSAQLLVPWGIWHLWSEVAELYLYIGIVLWVLEMGRKTIS